MSALHAGSPIEEVAAMVSEALAAAGITAVPSGGAAVQIYPEALYVSRNLDLASGPEEVRMRAEHPRSRW